MTAWTGHWIHHCGWELVPCDSSTFGHQFQDSWNTVGTAAAQPIESTNVRSGARACAIPNTTALDDVRFVGHVDGQIGDTIHGSAHNIIYYCFGVYVPDDTGLNTNDDFPLVKFHTDGDGGGCLGLGYDMTTVSPTRQFKFVIWRYDSSGNWIDETPVVTDDTNSAVDTFHWVVVAIDTANDLVKMWVTPDGGSERGPFPDSTGYSIPTDQQNYYEAYVYRCVKLGGKGSNTPLPVMDDWGMALHTDFTDPPDDAHGIYEAYAGSESDVEWGSDADDCVDYAPSASGEKAYFAFENEDSGEVEGVRMHFGGDHADNYGSPAHTLKGHTTGSIQTITGPAEKGWVYRSSSPHNHPRWGLQMQDTPDSTPATWDTTKFNAFIGGLLSGTDTTDSSIQTPVLTAMGRNLVGPPAATGQRRRGGLT